MILDIVTTNSNYCAVFDILHISDFSDYVGTCCVLDFVLRNLITMSKKEHICSFDALAILISLAYALEQTAEFISS